MSLIHPALSELLNINKYSKYKINKFTEKFPIINKRNMETSEKQDIKNQKNKNHTKYKESRNAKALSKLFDSFIEKNCKLYYGTN